MSDQRLRELERAASHGDPVDRAAVLREKCRAGLLTQERVELAAYCGDPGARLVEEWPPDDGLYHAPVYVDSVDACNGSRPNAACAYCAEFREWVSGLSLWGFDTLIRAASAATTVGLPVWEEEHDVTSYPADDPDAYSPRRAIEAVEAWVVCPCEEHREECRIRTEVIFPDMLLAAVEWSGPEDEGWTKGVDFWEVSIWEAERLTSPEAVRAAICTELVSWAFGDRDPVLERHRERLQAGARP